MMERRNREKEAEWKEMGIFCKKKHWKQRVAYEIPEVNLQHVVR